MLEMVLYGIGFFLITLLIQFLLSERNRKKNKQTAFWTGSSAIITICAMCVGRRSELRSPTVARRCLSVDT